MAQPSHGKPAEFSRPVIADTVATSGTVQTIEATAAERSALARRFDLVSLDALTATVRLRRVRGEFVRITGALEADVVQTCVVTLEPVPAHVSEEFSALYAPEHLVPKEEEEIDVTFAADDEDLPEAMVGGRIDIGELVAQHLSLALDPYPRKAGVTFDEIDETDDAPAAEEPVKRHPFADLERLKRPS